LTEGTTCGDCLYCEHKAGSGFDPFAWLPKGVAAPMQRTMGTCTQMKDEVIVVMLDWDGDDRPCTGDWFDGRA